MEHFWRALVLALTLEGLCFTLFPRLMRNAMLEASKQPDENLRAMGGMALAAALFLAFMTGCV